MTSAFAADGDTRSLPVPDGLDGMRLDQAVSRLLGLSRTAAAGLIDAGDALVDGVARPNSYKVKAGSWLEVTLPAPAAPPAVVPQAVPGLTVVYADDDIVVVDKPVGVAAHPSPGWTGPTVIGGLAGIATGSPRAAPRSGRVWCTGSTWAPPGSWRWPRASARTPR